MGNCLPSQPGGARVLPIAASTDGQRVGEQQQELQRGALELQLLELREQNSRLTSELHAHQHRGGPPGEQQAILALRVQQLEAQTASLQAQLVESRCPCLVLWYVMAVIIMP